MLDVPERFERSHTGKPDFFGSESPNRRERRRRYLSAWRAANRERLREYGRQWKLEHPDRIRVHRKNEYARRRGRRHDLRVRREAQRRRRALKRPPVWGNWE